MMRKKDIFIFNKNCLKYLEIQLIDMKKPNTNYKCMEKMNEQLANFPLNI